MVLLGCNQKIDGDCCPPSYPTCHPNTCKPKAALFYAWRRSTNIPSCTDIWTVQSQHSDDSNEELCRTDHNKDNLSVANFIGPYESLIHNWVNQSQPSFASRDFVPRFNINLNITVRSNFPTDLTSFKVKHFNVKPYESQRLPLLHLYNISYASA